MRVPSLAASLLLLLMSNVPAGADLPPILSESEPPSNAARQHYAEELLAYFVAANEAVPKLSPTQEQWLTGELASGKGELTKRLVDTVNSTEYLLREVKSGMATLIGLLTHIRDEKAGNLKEEIYWWSIVAYVLSAQNFGSSIQLLIDRGAISSPAFSFAVNPQPSFTDVDSVYSLVGHNIMSRIVMQFLSDKLRQ